MFLVVFATPTTNFDLNRGCGMVFTWKTGVWHTCGLFVVDQPAQIMASFQPPTNKPKRASHFDRNWIQEFKGIAISSG